MSLWLVGGSERAVLIGQTTETTWTWCNDILIKVLQHGGVEQVVSTTLCVCLIDLFIYISCFIHKTTGRTTSAPRTLLLLDILELWWAGPSNNGCPLHWDHDDWRNSPQENNVLLHTLTNDVTHICNIFLSNQPTARYWISSSDIYCMLATPPKRPKSIMRECSEIDWWGDKLHCMKKQHGRQKYDKY